LWPTAAFPGHCIIDVFCVPGTSVLPDSCHSESPTPRLRNRASGGTSEILKFWQVRSRCQVFSFPGFQVPAPDPRSENLPGPAAVTGMPTSGPQCLALGRFRREHAPAFGDALLWPGVSESSVQYRLGRHKDTTRCASSSFRYKYP